jgi:hypothetical protein
MSDGKKTSKTDAENGGDKGQGSESRTLTLLGDIKSGSVNPSCLCPADRRQLVSFLTVEGQSTAEIAHLLKVSDRTIERDKKALRKENAIVKDPRLVEQIVGRLMSEAEVCIQRIRKFQRDSDASAAAKMDGEHRCFQILSGLSERLQSLGFLPTATQKIEADLKYSATLSLSLEEIQDEAERLRRIREMLPDNGINHFEPAIEATETPFEFEDDSPQEDNKGENCEEDE